MNTERICDYCSQIDCPAQLETAEIDELDCDDFTPNSKAVLELDIILSGTYGSISRLDNTMERFM